MDDAETRRCTTQQSFLGGEEKASTPVRERHGYPAKLRAVADAGVPGGTSRTDAAKGDKEMDL